MDHQAFAQLMGNYGEFVGAIAVVVTLGYLAAQIKQARKATLAEIYQDRAHSRGANSLAVALNAPNFHEINFRFESNLEVMTPAQAAAELTDHEKYLVRMFHHDLIVRLDNVNFQYQQGFISEEYLDTVLRGLQRLVPVWKALGLERLFPRGSAEFFESAMAMSNENSNDTL